MGLVAQVFNEQNAAAASRGQVAIGHTRYSTTGSTHWSNAQPIVQHGRARTVALGHNGNLDQRQRAARRSSPRTASQLGATSDTEVIAALIANDPAPLEEAVANAMRRLEGAYSVVALAEGKLARASATRTASGRSCSGRIDGRLRCVASETCALDLVGAELEREVAPGEARRRSTRTASHATQAVPAGRSGRALHLRVLLPRPARLDARRDRGARARACGWASGSPRRRRSRPTSSLPIPDSGTPAAIGFSRASGIPFSEGLIKNRYVGRTFIQPDQEPARAGHPAEVQPARRGRRQARRGRRRLDRPRQHDARRSSRCSSTPARPEVHVRISSPPIVAPVLLRDRPRRRGAARRRVAHRSRRCRSRSARRRSRYLSLEGVRRATMSARERVLPRVLHRGRTRRACPAGKTLAKFRFEPSRA